MTYRGSVTLHNSRGVVETLACWTGQVPSVAFAGMLAGTTAPVDPCVGSEYPEDADCGYSESCCMGDEPIMRQLGTTMHFTITGRQVRRVCDALHFGDCD